MDVVGPPLRQRRRPALSCVLCRQRKVKCDRNLPCKQCKASGNRACTYVSNKKPILKTSPDPGSSSSSARNKPPGVSVFNASPEAYIQPPPPPPREAHDVSVITELAVRVKELEKQLKEVAVAPGDHYSHHTPGSDTASLIATPVSSAVSSSCFTKDVGMISSGLHLHSKPSKVRYLGQSHWMNAFDIFENIKCFKDNPTWAESRSLLKACKATNKAAKSQLNFDITLASDPKEYIPVREVADELVHLYLRTFESTYRILHVPTFMKEYNDYWNDPQASNMSFVIILLLVMAIGSVFYPVELPILCRHITLKRILTAQSYLYTPFPKARHNIGSLQIHCLLLLARQSNDIGGDLMWISAGSLLRVAMSMGLLRDPSFFPNLPVFEKEMRRRLWATVLDMAVQSSSDSGMPPMVSIEDYDTEPPANINDEDISEDMIAPPLSKPDDVYTQTSWLITLMKSLPARLRINKLMGAIHSNPSYDTIIHLSTSLSNICASHPSFFHLSSTNQNTAEQPNLFQKILLDLLTRRFLLVLHCSLAIQARTSPQFYFSRKTCLDAAQAILSYPSSPTSEPDDFQLLRLRCGSYFKEDPIHAALVLFFELLTQSSERSWVSGTDEGGRPLLEALERMVDVVRRRMELGERNAKCHVLMSMLLAQVKGCDVEGIKQAANSSAMFCLDVIQKRIAPVEPSMPDTTFPTPSGCEMENAANTFMPEMDFNSFELPDSWMFDGWDDDFL